MGRLLFTVLFIVVLVLPSAVARPNCWVNSSAPNLFTLEGSPHLSGSANGFCGRINVTGYYLASGCCTAGFCVFFQDPSSPQCASQDDVGFVSLIKNPAPCSFTSSDTGFFKVSGTRVGGLASCLGVTTQGRNIETTPCCCNSEIDTCLCVSNDLRACTMILG